MIPIELACGLEVRREEEDRAGKPRIRIWMDLDISRACGDAPAAEEEAVIDGAARF